MPVLEGRGTKARIKTELQYLVDSEWDWGVKRISGSEFLVNIPSKVVMNLLSKMEKIKFITTDILAVVEQTTMDPDTFQILQSVWVRALGFLIMLDLNLVSWNWLDWLVTLRKCIYHPCNGEQFGSKSHVRTLIRLEGLQRYSSTNRTRESHGIIQTK